MLRPITDAAGEATIAESVSRRRRRFYKYYDGRRRLGKGARGDS